MSANIVVHWVIVENISRLFVTVVTNVWMAVGSIEMVAVKDVPFRDIEMGFHTAKNYQKMNYYHRMICKS